MEPEDCTEIIGKKIIMEAREIRKFPKPIHLTKGDKGERASGKGGGLSPARAAVVIPSWSVQDKKKVKQYLDEYKKRK